MKTINLKSEKLRPETFAVLVLAAKKEGFEVIL